MKRILPYLIAAGCTFFASCSDRQPSANAPSPAPAQESAPPLDACALLTSEEIASVQGEPVQQTTPTTQSAGGAAVSQCYFALPTHSNSIVVTVTQASGANAGEVSKQWNDMFHSGEKRAEGGEEGDKTAPREVHGIGEAAYWTGSTISGALYVLKGNRYVRVSVGGPGEVNAKIDKAEALAEFILKRL